MDIKNIVHGVIQEELTKNDVNSMISSKIDSLTSSRDFERIIRKITSDCFEEFFKTLYQRSNMWTSSIKR